MTSINYTHPPHIVKRTISHGQIQARFEANLVAAFYLLIFSAFSLSLLGFLCIAPYADLNPKVSTVHINMNASVWRRLKQKSLRVTDNMRTKRHARVLGPTRNGTAHYILISPISLPFCPTCTCAFLSSVLCVLFLSTSFSTSRREPVLKTSHQSFARAKSELRSLSGLLDSLESNAASSDERCSRRQLLRKNLAANPYDKKGQGEENQFEVIISTFSPLKIGKNQET